MSIGDNIKRLREIHGMSQEEFAKILGVSDKAVSTWETNSKIPRMGIVQKMADHFGLKKSNIIEDDGLEITFTANPDLYKPSHLNKIPIYGTIQAGPPMFAAENIEGYEFADVPTPDDYFYLRVKGDSMINARIQDGDIVLVHRQSYADNGQIVACVVNGDEATLKRFRRLDTSIMLQPDNPSYDPIIVPLTDFDNGYAKVLGVVERVMFSVI